MRFWAATLDGNLARIVFARDLVKFAENRDHRCRISFPIRDVNRFSAIRASDTFTLFTVGAILLKLHTSRRLSYKIPIRGKLISPLFRAGILKIS